MAEEQSGKKKMMVAIDESECSHYALQWTLEKLKDTVLNSELILFSGQPLPNFNAFFASAYGVAPPEWISSVEENRRKLTLALLEKAKSICADHGITAVTMTKIGDPKEVICETAEKLNVKLLVLGTHGRGALERAFLGSVSNYCTQNAKCPVLIVRKTV